MTDDAKTTTTTTESTDNTEEFDLTDEQEDALVLDRNVTITAGAGTGKTTTLTERYLELLRSDPAITPKNIVTITFTRKAAAELETRVREEVYNELAKATTPEEYARWRGVLDDLADGYTHTIHAFCGRLLRENAIQAPVPMQFDTLDENDAADLQRQVVVEYIDAHESDADVQLASRLFGSHSRLVDILTGLLDERPDSEAWLETWRDRDVDDYMGYLWEHVCDLDAETARAFFDDPAVEDALTTATRFREEDFGTADDADGVRVLRDIATIVDGINGGDDRAYQQTCRELYDRLETSSGGLYSSASHHLVGTKSSWNGETDAYSDCKDALNTLIDQLSEIEAELKTTPGEVEENSAHYAIALLRIFDAVSDEYEAEKQQQEALDFPDLIETTIQFLRSNPDVRASLRESFAALMVDEFQDTDGRQWELVSLLSDLADDGVATDNVFLVGDKKQSIYGFRGAEVTTFDHAKDALRKQNQTLGRDELSDGSQSSPTDLELSGNFRTLEEPLTFLNELFDEVFEPEGDTYAEYEAQPQPLTCERDHPEITESIEGSVEYLLVPEDEESATALLDSEHPVTDAAVEHTSAAEAEALAGRLATLLADPPTIVDEDSGDTQPASPEDVAILLRRRTHLDRYQRALEKYDVPYSVVSGRGFYDAPEVQTLINLLRVLADPTDEISLYGVLRSPLFGFTDNRLAPLAASDDSLWETITTTDDTQIQQAAELLTSWRQAAGCVHSDQTDVLPWNRVLTQVFEDTGYLVSIGADENGKQAVANVEKFRDEIREWSEGGTRTAASLLRRIDRQAELDLSEGEAEVPEGTEGVRIMTIHGAKGLEFPIVTVPDLGADLNYGRSIDEYGYVRLITDHEQEPFLAAGGPSPNDAFDVEKTTAHDYADEIETSRERAEAKRLLYVACTRTRDHLLLCGTHEVEASDEGLSLGDVNDLEEASRWRDWLQPTLLEHDGVLAELTASGHTQMELSGAEYRIRIPEAASALPAAADQSKSKTDQYPQIEIPAPEAGEATQHLTATDLVKAASEYDSDDEENESSSEEDTDDGEQGLQRNDFGTIVHRILEFDAPQSEWPELARRIAGVNGFEITDEDIEEIIEHAADAAEFLRADAAKYGESETYEELSVSVDIGDLQIIGDIDHLRVTPDAFVITDYKTNQLSNQTTEGLAEYYRPQLMSYALALLDHDPDRKVRAQLRFTETGTTESLECDYSDWDRFSERLIEIGRNTDDQ